MNFTDYRIRKLAKSEPFETPDEVHKRVEQILNDLPEKQTITPRPRPMTVIRIAACLALVFMIMLPNVSPVCAAAMERIPIIGKLIEVVTVRNYFDRQGDSVINIEVPEVQNQIADAINKDADELAQILIHEFYHDLDIVGSEGHISFRMDYEKVLDSPDWFTLKLDATQIQASTNHTIKYYHIDKKLGQIVKLSDLFQNDTYQTVLKEKIHRQMTAQMAEDDGIVYWDGSRPKIKDMVSIDPDQNFYWNQAGNLVLVYDKYDVAPGSMDCPEFEISIDEIQDILKPEYRKAE